jgi:hypothetical protein
VREHRSEGQFSVLHQYLASSGLLVWLKKAFFTGGSKRSRQHTCKSLSGKQRFSLSSLAAEVLCKLTTAGRAGDATLVDVKEDRIYALTGDGSVHALRHPYGAF